MHWGKRRYHRESYSTRQHAKYTRRLRKKLIPGYGQHRKYDIKQWQNRVHERYYRQHTFPSQSERFRRWTDRIPAFLSLGLAGLIDVEVEEP